MTRSGVARGRRHVLTLRHRALGALIGVLVGGVALGVGQLAAAFIARAASPIVAVGQTAIDLSPEWLKSFAIRMFGLHDKTALRVGIVIVLAVLAALLGVAAMRSAWVGYAGLAVLGAIGVLAALGLPASGSAWGVPSIAAAGAGALALVVLLRAAGQARAQLDRDTGMAAEEASAPAGFDRRRFLQVAFAMGATAALSDFAAGFIGTRRAVEVSRASVRIPAPESPAPQLPTDAQLHVPGLSPFFTPDTDFFRVDTTLLVPQIRAQDWRLRIHGMVEREIEIDFEQLIARPLIERDITLTCVSNEVGGHLVGNARWIGAALKPLMDEVGVHPGADQIVSTSSDGMTIGTPTAIALDGRDSMLAQAMNGQPLPFEHGFPVRMLVPGLYGYESAMKWIVDMELATLGAYQAYWVKGGWAQVAPIKTGSRIDTPRDGAGVSAGSVTVAGLAWAESGGGVSRVEVRVDGGGWNVATLAAQDTIYTWRQWIWQWAATPGTHTLEVRATDGAGDVQTETQTAPFPAGATGWQQIQVNVS